jgi:microcystin-dependent protein
MSVAGSANADIPIGVILPYGGFIAPKGGFYLLCDGSVFDPVEYSVLYGVIGTTYGGTAQAPLLPDMRGRYALGQLEGETTIGEKIDPTLSGTQTFTLVASDIPTLSPLTNTPAFDVDITQTVYTQTPSAQMNTTSSPYDVAVSNDTSVTPLKFVTTLTGSTVTYTAPAPADPIVNGITAQTVAYGGYDMTYIIKAKGF